MNFVGSIPRGRPGTSGFQGASGASGYSGISGRSGFSGISGFSGYSGFATPSGPALVQQKTATAADGSAGVTATFDAPLTANSMIIAEISYVSTAVINDPLALDDGAGTLSLAARSAGSGVISEIYYLFFGGVENPTLLSFSADLPVRASVNVQEWHGLLDAAPDDTDTNSATASTTVTTNSVTPATAHSLTVATYASVLNSFASGPINSYTALTATGGTGAFQREAYLVQSSASATSTGWTISIDNWAACIAVFRAP